MYNIKKRIYMVTLMEVTYMKTKRISGFQWTLTIFVFFVVTMALSLILRDFQASIGIKRFVFSINNLAPFIAAIICIIAFKNKRTQLAGLNFSIFIIGMMSFNRFADSFILLQANDLSVSVFTIMIGHIFMAFFAEFGFRSYLQNIVESKVNTFFASIIVGLMYSIWTINTTYGMQYAGYHFLYTFMFSMIVGELIRATKGRTIYIAMLFHAAMTFTQVFLFSEETGDLFSMKVIALSTTIVGIIFILLSLVIRFILYKTTNQSLDEVEPNNYLDHVNDDIDDSNKISNSELDKKETSHQSLQENNVTHTQTNESEVQDGDHHLKSSSKYTENRRSSVVDNVKEEINDIHKSNK